MHVCLLNQHYACRVRADADSGPSIVVSCMWGVWLPAQAVTARPGVL